MLKLILLGEAFKPRLKELKNLEHDVGIHVAQKKITICFDAEFTEEEEVF